MRPGRQFDHVSLLIREGFGDSRIAALTGIPRSTVRDWRRNCNVLGGSYGNSKPDTVSIAKREDVATLDSFVGPKT
jgi:hypothetical protein